MDEEQRSIDVIYNLPIEELTPEEVQRLIDFKVELAANLARMQALEEQQAEIDRLTAERDAAIAANDSAEFDRLVKDILGGD